MGFGRSLPRLSILIYVETASLYLFHLKRLGIFFRGSTTLYAVLGSPVRRQRGVSETDHWLRGILTTAAVLFFKCCHFTTAVSPWPSPIAVMSSSTNGIVVVGCVSDASFHRCCRMVKVLNGAGLSAKVSEPLFDTQYEEYLREKKTHVGGSIFEHTAKHLVLQDGGRKYMGGVEELIGYVESMVAPPYDRSEDDSKDWVAIAQQQCEKHLLSSHCPLVFLDVSLDPASRPQRVVFQLYSQDCPITCENFRSLCTGEKGKSADGTKLSYKGSPFHRVVRDAWVQGGDILSGAGDSGCSIYGETFGDESFAVKLNESGVLAMANDGPHTNSSQFLVTLAPQPWLNHKVVGFGRVIKGMKVFREMSEAETLNQRPVVECKVQKCGQITAEEYAKFSCK